ncbi:hypothetical protein Tco_0997846 [Tanacetum coccineum]
MDNPNITMEEYIRLEQEKTCRHGKVYNWETATYGKIWDNEDVHDFGSVETEFPAIVFNDTLTSEGALSSEPTISSLNNDEIDFRISFDESDDEDCTIIFDKKSFSYKIISVNDLKTNSGNDNDKVNMFLLPSPEPTVSYFDDLDYFKDFEKEFPTIVYNDAQTSKFDFLTEPTVSHQHMHEFNSKDETSLSECDEEEQNVLNFNDLFPFNESKNQKISVTVIREYDSRVVIPDEESLKAESRFENMVWSRCRYGVSKVLVTAYWVFLGVGITFDIFQNIHLLYLQYGVLVFTGYDVLIMWSSWSLVSAGTDTPYLP